jgi:AraC-like DNA-binding protein
MQYIETPPVAALTRHLECVWMVRDRPRRKRTPDRVLPDGCPEWIVHIGDPFERWSGDRWLVQPTGFFAGTLSKPWVLRAGTRVCTLGIRFKPGAAAALLNMDLSNAADREIDLATVLGPAALALAAAVKGQRTTAQRLQAAQDHLVRLCRSRLQIHPRSHAAVRCIVRSKGTVRVAALAAAVGTTRRTLERIFRRELGVSPKQYARIVRLNAVLASLDLEQREQTVQVALDMGYFDQAHLLRDFRALAGRKPQAKPHADGQLARHFTHPKRLQRLLDGD